MPTNAMFFLVFWFGMVGAGLLMIRVWVVDRLRIINGGVQSSRVRVGKRIADVVVLFLLATAFFWLIMALINLSSGGPK